MLKLSQPNANDLGYVDSVSVQEISGVRIRLPWEFIDSFDLAWRWKQQQWQRRHKQKPLTLDSKYKFFVQNLIMRWKEIHSKKTVTLTKSEYQLDLLSSTPILFVNICIDKLVTKM
ncbi:uncharacterized protein LOC128195889 [Vigna angularis]|uniref:uncharacterized protein LOC128195889 n=1 Tax=Phaseolus angularis TaxID=3914 RepID=UPI0022B5A26A|nr:uncharacterized protein LOC128195889 [Vigna angularis]